jgi:hypothetical protein
MGVNVSSDFLDLAAGFFNFRIGNLLFKYLGLPVDVNPRLYSTWTPMLDVVKRRLGTWGNKYISLGGRIVLINGLSKKKRICWVKWDHICKPKREEGSGIRDFRVLNLSLLAKWRSRLLSEDDAVWKNIIKAKFGDRALGNERLDETVVGNMCSPWWRNLCRLDND